MENLLSKNDKELLKSGYKKRLIIMWCWMVVLALPIFFILSTPLYIAAGLKLSEIIERNKVNEHANADQSSVFSLPELIDKKSEAILAYRNLRGSYQLTDAVIRAAPSGISVDEVVFERSKSKKPDEMKISGMAKDREALSAYQQSVKDLSFVSSAYVPVESFSRPVNLSFFVQVTLATSTDPE